MRAPPWRKAPVLYRDVAAMVLIINVLLPGCGTMVGGRQGRRPLVRRGIAQLLLAPLFVGWAWSVWTGFQCVINAQWARDEKAKALGLTA